jgi:hypothetical protein
LTPFFAASKDLSLAAVVSRDPERQAKARADHPGAILLGTAEELLAPAKDLDLVVVATPNRSHVPLAALQAELPVVVDSPALPRGALLHLLQGRRREAGRAGTNAPEDHELLMTEPEPRSLGRTKSLSHGGLAALTKLRTI